MEQLGNLGREQQQGQHDQMKREELHRNVVRHVQDEDLDRIEQANQRAQRSRLRNEQQHAAGQLGETDDDFIRT